MMTSTRSRSPISRSGKRSAFSGSISGYSRPCSRRFIWQSRYGSGLASHAEECFASADGCGLRRVLHCFCKMLEGLHQEAAGAAGRIENVSPRRGFSDVDHESHHGARRVELAGIAGGVAHLLSMDSYRWPSVWISSFE